MDLLKNKLIQMLPLSVLAAAFPAVNETQVVRRPNVVMIVSDYHGPDDLGC
jgi:hypothetical protein